jgi:hypothetical protein
MLNLLADLDLTLGLCGCTSMDEMTRERLLRAAPDGTLINDA